MGGGKNDLSPELDSMRTHLKGKQGALVKGEGGTVGGWRLEG